MSKTTAIYKKSIGDKFPILMCLQGEVPAKIFQSLAKGEGLGVQSHLSLGNISDAYEIKSHDISFGKTLKECLVLGEDSTSETYSLLFPKVGILSGGKFSTPKISVSLKTGSVSLSSVLEPIKKVPQKYFLTKKQLKSLLSRGGGQLRKQSSNTLRTNYSNGHSNETYVGEIQVANKGASQHYRVYKEGGVAPTLQSQSGWSSQKHPFILIPSATKSGYEIAEDGDGLRLSFIGSATGRGRVGRKKAQALMTNGDAYVYAYGRVRRLMPVECERLMSWLDNHTKFGIDEKGNKVEISDSQRYCQCGNGVVSNVIREVIKNLLTP